MQLKLEYNLQCFHDIFMDIQKKFQRTFDKELIFFFYFVKHQFKKLYYATN